MLRFKHVACIALVALAAGCGGDAGSIVGPEGGPSPIVSDAAHAGAVQGFYFLPPMVAAPTFSGTFDAALSPRVEICEVVAGSCSTVIAQYTTTSGSGSETVRLNAAQQNYAVNWHTNDFNLDPAKHYRISVFVGSFRLGFADVDVVGTGKELKNVDSNQYIALVDGRTLPIKFRIETGVVAAVVVTPATATISAGQTQQFTATLTDLHGNTITGPVSWTTSNAAVATIDGSGLATGVAPGTVTVTATSGGASGTATLVVVNPNTPPVANADAYDAIGNVTVPVAAPGVLANDTDGESNTLTVTAGTFATAAGGTVTLNADGSFTYLSAAGFTGSDSFQYEASDGSATATGTVAVTVNGRVWYVSNAAAAPGDGRDASPFTTLAAAEGASGPGETIFLLAGNGSTTGYDQGITLKAGQALTGQGVTSNISASLNGQSVLLLAAGSTPSITRTSAGPTIQLATGNTVQGVSVASTAGAGIAGSAFGTFTAGSISVSAVGGPALDLQTGSVAAAFGSLSSTGSTGAGLRLHALSGTLTADGGSITGAAGTGVHVSGGDANIAYGGSVTNATGRAVSVTGRSGGSLALSGSINETGTGILVSGNTGGTISFTGPAKTLDTGASTAFDLQNNTGATINVQGGGLDITTTSGNGFSATGGGTVNVTGAGNRVVSGTGRAVNLQNVSLGTLGVTFRSVSANGGASGIVLDGTGAAGGFKVTGDGATAGSGGTIQNSTQRGVRASSTVNLSLSFMNFLNNGTANLSAAATCGDALNGLNTSCAAAIDLQSVTGVTIANDSIDGGAQIGINGNGVQNLTITNTAVRNVGNEVNEDGVQMVNLTGTNTVTNSRFVSTFHRGLEVQNSTGTSSLTVTGSTFDRGSYLSTSSDGLAVVMHGTATMNATVRSSTFRRWFGGGVFGRALGDATMSLTVGDTTAGGAANGNTFTDNSLMTQMVSDGTADMTFGVGHNTHTVSGVVTSGATPVAFRKGVGATGAYQGTFAFNTIGNGTAGSGSNCTGCNGVSMTDEGASGGYDVRVVSNLIQNVNQRGVETILQFNDAMSVIVRDNTIRFPDGTSGQAIYAQSNNDATDNGALCMDIRANTIGGTWDTGVPGGRNIRVRQGSAGGSPPAPATGAPFLVVGLTGSTAADMQSYLNTNNGITNASATALGGFTSVASCP